MKIGIGIPNCLPQTDGTIFVPWAQKAEEHGFSSLSTIGRIVFDGYEELIVLSAAAAVTRKIRLMTTVMIGPPRETVMLAKQAASLHQISAGRLTLGLGIGWRSDDFEVVGRGGDWSRRGELLDQQVARLREIWSGREIGPCSNDHPEILLGGAATAALQRAGRLADAFIAGPFSPEETRQHFAIVDAAAGPKKPRRVCSRYFALGDDVTQAMESNARAYYKAGGEDFVQTMMGGILRTPEDIRRAVVDLEATGADELCFWP
jgi:alkanesulfonate monooxygenase SsuD/methylene tetrahydromethanopterin reductase-like flavin-dependent oxidoreductase (luciferase family)